MKQWGYKHFLWLVFMAVLLGSSEESFSLSYETATVIFFTWSKNNGFYWVTGTRASYDNIECMMVSLSSFFIQITKNGSLFIQEEK